MPKFIVTALGWQGTVYWKKRGTNISCWCLRQFIVLFQGLFAEYIELLVQFGYLSLFSCVYPLMAVLLLINNLTEIRSDAYKICKLFRKPFSPPVANMGVWQVSRKHNARLNCAAAGVSYPLSYETNMSCYCLVFQIAFEVLSFVSVMSNCWLLLSPRLQELLQEGGMSSTNIVLLAVLVEVRGRKKRSIVRDCVWWCHYSSACLQHVLILVKVVLRVLIPDEPDWIRKKREHIEYTSMQALREQVNPKMFNCSPFWCSP